MNVFAFRPFIPLVLAGLSGKQKETNSLRSLRLSGDYSFLSSGDTNHSFFR
jgi:hypothetical protein